MGIFDFLSRLTTGARRDSSRRAPNTSAAGPPSDNPGGEVVRLIYTHLVGADAKWSVWDSAGFTWWAHRQAQRIWTSPSLVIDGIRVARVVAETEVVQGVPDTPVLRQALRELNGDASFSAFNWLPDGRITLAASVIAHEGNVQWLQRLLNVVAALQAAEALDASQTLAKSLSVAPAYSQHPDHGNRPAPDAMLGGIIDLVAVQAARQEASGSAIQGPSPYAQLESILAPSDCDLEGTPQQFTVSVPFGQKTAQVRVDTAAYHPMGRGVLDSLGFGVQVSATIPIAHSSAHSGYDQPLNQAEVLNLESRSDALAADSQSTLGAWIPNPLARDHTALTLFIPSLIAQGGIVANVVGAVVGRVRLLGERTANS
jgi:hypothetical protein